MVSDAPVFLLGAPRSGTSLLYRMLCQHPHVTYLNQYVRRLPAAPELASLNRLPRHHVERRAKTWFADGNAYVYGGRRGVAQRTFPQPVEGEPFFRHWGLPTAVSPQEAGSWEPERLRTGVGRLTRADGGRRFVSKRIDHNRRVAALRRAFPRARFVHLVRDGRAVAKSLLAVDWWPTCDVWALRTTPPAWLQDGRDEWELAVRHWVAEVTAVDEGIKGLPVDQIRTITYETLVGAPVETLVGLAEFIGLEPDDRWLRASPDGRAIDPAAASGSLTNDQLATAHRWQGSLLERHGYSSRRSTP